MIFTTRMRFLSAVVLDTDMEAVTRELLQQGVLDFISIRELNILERNRVETVEPKVSEARLKESRRRIESFLDMVDIRPGYEHALSIDEFEPLDPDAVERELDGIGTEVQGRRNRQGELQQDILKLEEIRRQFDAYQNLQEGLLSRSQYSFLSIQAGYIHPRHVQEFTRAIAPYPSVYLDMGAPDKPAFLLISLKRDEARIRSILSSVGWTDVEFPEEVRQSKDDALSHIDTKLAALRENRDRLNREVTEVLQGRAERLQDIWKRCALNELYYKIQSRFGKTARTVLFSGWLPASKQKDLEKGILDVTEGIAFLEWKDPDTAVRMEGVSDVPVQMKNPGFLRPFQAMVQNYAIPEYGTIDPTPVVAVVYLMMFGLMYGDAGHGLVIMVAGIIGWVLRKRSKKGTILSQLITWCGGAAVITGILYGSYFGMPWFDPLWFDFHGLISGHPRTGNLRDIYDVLKITIYFGIGVITLGLFFNWINSIRRKRWFHLFFGKAGLLGGWIYGAGIYIAFYFVRHDYKGLPPGRFIIYLVAVPVVLLFLKAPVEFQLHRKEHPEKAFTPFTVIDFFMEWIVEILEIFSGYLANTLSFMRVAGLGIAHASLMIAFFSIARMVSPGDGISIGGIAVLVAGNAMVIVLEGLSAGIQALRLNYYEFFNKYFTGSGKAYAPISLKGSLN